MQQFFQFFTDSLFFELLISIGMVCLGIDCNSLHRQVKSLQQRINRMESAQSMGYSGAGAEPIAAEPSSKTA